MTAASKLIRDSIAGLPVRPDDRWVAYEDGLIWADGWDGAVLAGDPMAGSQHPEVAAHIALLASPHVAAAVADLLDAIDELRLQWDLSDANAWATRVEDRAEALEAAITRTGGNP